MLCPNGTLVSGKAFKIGRIVVFSAVVSATKDITEADVLIQFSGITASSRYDFAMFTGSEFVTDGYLAQGSGYIYPNALTITRGNTVFLSGTFICNN